MTSTGETQDMAIAPAPRVYGLDAICAAALAGAGGDEAAQFARRLFEPRRRQGPGRRARRSSGPRPPLPCWPSPAAACPASPRSGCSIRPTPSHGFESRHTVVQIVNDDMPFLVDSIANEFNRREIAVHLLAHPVLAVRRDLDGDLLGFGPEAGERARPRIDDAHRDRPPGRSRPARRTRRGAHPRAGRSAARGRRLAADAPGLPRRHRRPRARPLAQPRRVRGLPALAGGRPLHLPRPSPLPLCRRRQRRPAACATTWCRARRWASCGATRFGCSMPGLGGGEAMARFARGPRQHPDRQDRPRLAGPSQRADGLRDRQDLRRRRPGHRRAAPGRPVHVGRLSRDGGTTCRCCAAGSTACCAAPASMPTATTARRCWRSSIPIRATSCSRSTRTRSTTMCWASCSCRSAAAWRCSRAATPSAASPPAWSSRRASASMQR